MQYKNSYFFNTNGMYLILFFIRNKIRNLSLIMTGICSIGHLEVGV